MSWKGDVVSSAATRETAVSLRERWREASLRATWRFPSDWYLPAVDAVCEAVAGRTDRAAPDLDAAAWRLGAGRARSAVGLGETLLDIDALIGALGDAAGAVAVAVTRSVSLGWADGSAPPPNPVIDGMTGLTCPEYLVARVAELFREAEATGTAVGAHRVLVVVRLPVPRAGAGAWDLPMVLVARDMRATFSRGESLARLGPSVAVVLAHRAPELGGQVRALREMLAATFHGAEMPTVWIEPLAGSQALLRRLLEDLAR